MNGRDALKIAHAAMRFVAADQRRKAARERYEVGMRAAVAAGTLQVDDDGAVIGPEDVTEDRAEFRSAAASVAGYRRGLNKACEPALRSGVPVPGLAAARKGRG